MAVGDLVVLLVVLAVIVMVAGPAVQRLRQAAPRPQLTAPPKWRIVERSTDGVTHVQLRLVGVGPDGTPAVHDVREVGQVEDADPDYDDKLLTLRAKAQQRLAVVDHD